MRIPRFQNFSRFSSRAALALITIQAIGADWKIEDQSFAQDAVSPFVHERKLVSKLPGGTAKRIDLVWFDAEKHTIRVIDNRSPIDPIYAGLEEAMRQNDCLAGCNGGFFLKNHDPSGLMIASGAATGRFGEGALLSGVILSSGHRNAYLLRRAEYEAAKYKATDLIQSGPFLVDQGATVPGLSPENTRRRTFVLHDGGHGFALGLSDAFTLAELGEILARPDLSPARRIHRALNLDGGTSSGLYLDRGAVGGPLCVEPLKTVRNFIGIVPR